MAYLLSVSTIYLSAYLWLHGDDIDEYRFYWRYITYKMDSDQDDQYVVIIVECCENCDTHQNITRHSQWKYFEQFNEFKRKIERFVPNTIVVKNPIPDQLFKSTDGNLNKNQYINRDSKQIVLFPRVGSFEVYIYNVLVYSKLFSNSWPNHYKLVQVLNKVIEENKKGNSLEEFSVYRGDIPVPQDERPKPHTSKKKKKDYRVYKSKDKPNLISHNESPIKKPNLDPINAAGQKNTKRRTLLEKQKDQNDFSETRGLETKAENRVRLPSLKNTINFKEEEDLSIEQESSSILKSKKQSSARQKEKGLKKIFNSIEQFQKEELSFIDRKSIRDDNQFNSLTLQEANESIQLMKSLKGQDSMRFLQNRSVQYSEKEFGKDFMNRSIQYEEDEGRYLDFGLQFDDGTAPKQINAHFVQTDKIIIAEEPEQKPKNPYMLDEQIQAEIIVQKDQKNQQVQTLVKQYENIQTNTEAKSLVNRGYQYPQEEIPKVDKTEFNKIDEDFKHLFQKRRNIHDEESFYSVDKFQQKTTKYKWIGRAGMLEPSSNKPSNSQAAKQNIGVLRKAFTLQMLVFCFYNYFGVKTPHKRLSFQSCSNVITNPDQAGNRINSKKSDTALVHVLTLDNPALQYPQIFEECDYSEHKYPLAEELTFRSSKQRIKFTNYGGLLALAYFLGDRQLFNAKRSHIGLVISNDEVKQIYKLTADCYNIQNGYNPSKNKIVVDDAQGSQQNKASVIGLDRMSEEVEIQFIAMLSKILSQMHFNELLRNLQDNFVEMLPSHQIFKGAILSTKLEKLDKELISEFVDMLKTRRERMQELYKGEIYAYHRYRTLQPKISFNLECFAKKDETAHLDTAASQAENPQHIELERTFTYNNKLVKGAEIQKNVRNKDNFVIIQGESGLGKTTFVMSMIKNLEKSYGDKLRIRKIGPQVLTDSIIMEKRVNQILDEHRKQIIVVDSAETYFEQTVEFMQKIYNKQDPRSRPEMSFILAVSTNGRYSQGIRFRSRVLQYNLEIIICQLMPLDVEDIRTYMMKCIQFHSFTGKKNFLIELLGEQNLAFSETHPKYKIIRVLQNPFYLRLYTQYLGHISNLDDNKACLFYSFCRYSLLKQASIICYKRHLKQTDEMVQQFKDETGLFLKKIAFQYFHNNCQVTESIRDLSNRIATQDQIITNQLAFYPMNIQALVKRNIPLFLHRQYLHFFLVEAYCFYIQKSYKNLNMQKLYANEDLLNLISEHYSVEHTHSKLIEIVQKSRKYKNTKQQASCALTLLAKIGFVFSNYNLDEVEIPDADISQAVFYATSFRSANLSNVQCYRTQMIGCSIDGAKMDNINLLVRKYQIEYTVLTAAMSNDGRNLALGCGNYLLIVQTDTGKQLKKIEAHMDIIRTVKYSKDSTTLVTIADDKTLRIWDTRTYRSVVFRLPQKGTIAFSSQTQTIASVSKNNLKVWNIKSMANQFVLEGHSDLITCIQFSVDGKHIVTGSRDTTLKLWKLSKGELVRTMKGHPGELLAAKISPTKRLIVSSSKQKDLMVWGFEKGNQISRTKMADEVIEICLDEKQKYAAIAVAKQHKIIVLNLETLEPVHELQGHRGRILSINFDFSYKKLISLGKDKTVRVWDFEKIMMFESKEYQEKTKSRLKSSKRPILAMAFCRVSHKYATAHSNGEIIIYSAIDNRIVDQLLSHNGAVRCLQYDKTGKLYSGGSDGIVRVWNLQARRQPRTIQLHSSQIVEMRLSEKNKVLCTASSANQLVVVDFTGINIIMSTREEGRVQAIDFSKDEKILAVGGTEKYIAIYDVSDSGSTINRKEELGPNSDVITCLKFQGDLYLVAALQNGQVAIWNHARGALMKKIQNISPITSVLNFQRKYVCFTSKDGKVRVVDMNQGKEVKIFRYFEQATAVITNTGENLLYMGTDSGNVVIWNLDSIKAKNQKVQFDRLTFDEEGNKVVHIEGPRELLIRDLHFHEEEYINVKDAPSPIQGVTFYDGEIVLLLKNGMHWDVKKNKEFIFGSEQKMEGQLQWIKDKGETNFFKTAVKKIRGIKRPIQAVLEELSTI